MEPKTLLRPYFLVMQCRSWEVGCDFQICSLERATFLERLLCARVQGLGCPH